MSDDGPYEDIIRSPSGAEPSTSSTDKDSKKKGGPVFNFKEKAMNVVSGIKRKTKKDLENNRSRSHEDIGPDRGDQAGPSQDKGKNSPFNKMMNNFPNPGPKLNKMWNSLHKTFSSATSEFPEVAGSRSTMTLGRFFGKKRDNEQSSDKDERKAHTLGRMFNFKMPPLKNKANRSEGPQVAKTEEDV